jgi:hypothetical protein
MAEFGGIYWDEEEASFLRISKKLDEFYLELFDLTKRFLEEKNISYNEGELQEAIQYQKLRIPTLLPPHSREYHFNHNFPEYFETRLTDNARSLIYAPQVLTLHPKDYRGEPAHYARETILWGRKSGTMLTKVSWQNKISEEAITVG